MRELFSLDKEVLGEACGIFAGDGGLYRAGRSHVLEIRGARKDLDYYEHHAKPLLEEVLQAKLKTGRRSHQGGHMVCLRACGGRGMKLFHVFLQFPVGRKANSLQMPKLIFNNHEYWKAYVRGVFDTRGSLYLRRTAKRKGKEYRNPVLEISSPSLAHLMQLREILRDMGFGFWLEKSNYKIRLAGRKNVERFFKEINPHNNAKRKKFAEIMRTGK